jgi:hypothetical protein
MDGDGRSDRRDWYRAGQKPRNRRQSPARPSDRPTLNESLDVPVPTGVVTEIAPLVAPDGTVAVIVDASTTVNAVAATPPNSTDVAPVRFGPVIVTTEPTAGRLIDRHPRSRGGFR